MLIRVPTPVSTRSYLLPCRENRGEFRFPANQLRAEAASLAGHLQLGKLADARGEQLGEVGRLEHGLLRLELALSRCFASRAVRAHCRAATTGKSAEFVVPVM